MYLRTRLTSSQFAIFISELVGEAIGGAVGVLRAKSKVREGRSAAGCRVIDAVVVSVQTTEYVKHNHNDRNKTTTKIIVEYFLTNKSHSISMWVVASCKVPEVSCGLEVANHTADSNKQT